jgi:hypothetical protein
VPYLNWLNLIKYTREWVDSNDWLRRKRLSDNFDGYLLINYWKLN